MTFIQQYLLYFKIAGVVAIVAAVFGAGWMANGWRLNADIANIKAAHADEKTIQANGALKELVDAAKIIRAAASDASINIADLTAKLDTLSTEFKNAKPLPVDCRPDDFRMLHLAAAVDAVSKALAGSKPGTTVPSADSP